MKKRTGKQMMVIGIAYCAAIGAMAIPAGTYFTAANIWYENPERIYSTNYHAGEIIPGGTEVEVISSRKGRVEFRVAGEEEVYRYTYVKRHSSMSFEEEFGRKFTEQNQFADVVSGSDAEIQQAIAEGSVVEGMSKDQVIASYGYPTSHVTPDTDNADEWKYWIKRASNKVVTFDNGIVTSIEK